MAESFLKSEIPKIVLFVAGLITILGFFLPYELGTQMRTTISSWTVIISNTSVFLGLYYMVTSQIRELRRNRTTIGYFWFAVPFIGLFTFLFSALAFPGYTNSIQYQWVYTYIYRAQVQMYLSVPMFFLFGAMYSSFQLKSIEAVALALGGVVYTLRLIPLFTYLFPPLIDIGDWILFVPGVAGDRSAMIPLGIASIALGLRTIFGREESLGG